MVEMKDNFMRCSREIFKTHRIVDVPGFIDFAILAQNIKTVTVHAPNENNRKNSEKYDPDNY